MSEVRFETWLVRPVRECGLDFLSADEAERAARFLRQEDRDSFVSTRTALRCLLADDAKVHPGALHFTANGWGRPVLNPPSPDFNVAYTEGASPRSRSRTVRASGATLSVCARCPTAPGLPPTFLRLRWCGGLRTFQRQSAMRCSCGSGPPARHG
jgi:hypothetical protein